MYLFVPKKKKLLSNNMCFVPLGGYQLANILWLTTLKCGRE